MTSRSQGSVRSPDGSWRSPLLFALELRRLRLMNGAIRHRWVRVEWRVESRRSLL
ncbi:MAG: hypothetical protein HC840_23050 [Leptolyngbyaceae cyanobacterium RM2_2_4]|nr:hypothetical protein [Leptolyngbyaceae cyanobacterium RM2_2_4]